MTIQLEQSISLHRTLDDFVLIADDVRTAIINENHELERVNHTLNQFIHQETESVFQPMDNNNDSGIISSSDDSHSHVSSHVTHLKQTIKANSDSIINSSMKASNSRHCVYCMRESVSILDEAYSLHSKQTYTCALCKGVERKEKKLNKLSNSQSSSVLTEKSQNGLENDVKRTDKQVVHKSSPHKSTTSRATIDIATPEKKTRKNEKLKDSKLDKNLDSQVEHNQANNHVKQLITRDSKMRNRLNSARDEIFLTDALD